MRKNRRTAALLLVLALLATALIVIPGAALRDPAAVYCTAMNYTFTLAPAAGGGMADTCILPGNRPVDAWQFLQGQVAPEYSYCAKQGYTQTVITDADACSVFMTQSCAACVLPDGSATEVTKLMKLDFRERLCSGGKCCDPKDGAACSFDPVLVKPLWLIGAAVIIILMAGAFLFLRRKKRM